MAFGNTHLIFFNSATRHLITHEQQDEQTRNNGTENVAECEQNEFHFGNPVSRTDYRTTTERITAIFERLVRYGVDWCSHSYRLTLTQTHEAVLKFPLKSGFLASAVRADVLWSC
jgi:hypothetical protein